MPTSAPTPGRNPDMRGRRDRHFFSSDDSALSKQIVDTHATDFRDVKVKPVLSITMDILRLEGPRGIAETLLLHQPKAEEFAEEFEEAMACPIKISMDLLRSLSSYWWDAKVVIAFSAFAVNYGEFWPVVYGEAIEIKAQRWRRLSDWVKKFNTNTKDPPTKMIGILKDLPDLRAIADELKKKSDAVHDLLNSAMKVAHCIIAFKDLPLMYNISRESPEITAATAHIPPAVYWIIRSLLVCSFTLHSMIGNVTSAAESWEILSLNHKIQVIMDHLQCQLRICKHLVDRKKAEDAYEAFVKIIESSHINNMNVLRAMVRSKDDQRPLYDGHTQRTERLDALRMKYVLLLISDLDLSQERLTVVHLMHRMSPDMSHKLAFVWLPIIPDQLTLMEDNAFYELQYIMPWFSVKHPSLVEPAAIRYIREVWKFVGTPMLVVLDPHQGRPSNLNALPMMWIWGSKAFPFTEARESALWSESRWDIELLLDEIDLRFTDWIRDEKVICLYGGDDIHWIRRFTQTARSVASDLKVNMEMLYVGKRNPKEKVQECRDVIVSQNLSHLLSVTEFSDYVWYFWGRLMSMWNSKSKIGMAVQNDPIMQEIKDVLTLDSSDQGWAVLSRGNHEIIKADGKKLLQVLESNKYWRHLVDHPAKFVIVVDKQVRRADSVYHCNRLILPEQGSYIPQRLVCSDCGRTMGKYVMYSCCPD